MQCLNEVAIKHLVLKINSVLTKRGLSDDFAGHDLFHHARVAHLTLELMEKERILCDSYALFISALLHDVHRLMSNDITHYVAPEESIPLVIEIIEESGVGVTDEQLDIITECVTKHEDYSIDDENGTDSSEALLLQDADNLDALGLEGFVRTIQYGTRLLKPFFVFGEDECFDILAYHEGSHNNQSTVEHMKTKLVNLHSIMNTATARQYAEKRTNRLVALIDEIEKGWSSGLIS